MSHIFIRASCAWMHFYYWWTQWRTFEASACSSLENVRGPSGFDIFFLCSTWIQRSHIKPRTRRRRLFGMVPHFHGVSRRVHVYSIESLMTAHVTVSAAEDVTVQTQTCPRSGIREAAFAPTATKSCSKKLYSRLCCGSLRQKCSELFSVTPAAFYSTPTLCQQRW